MGMFYNFAHYHARTPCSLHGASAYFRHHSSFEIVCGSAFVNGYERTKLCHSAVGLYPSQPISQLAHYSYFPTNLLSIEIGSIRQIGACVVGIHPTVSPTDCASSIIVREPNSLLGRDQIREYQGIWKIEQVAGAAVIPLWGWVARSYHIEIEQGTIWMTSPKDSRLRTGRFNNYGIDPNLS